MTASEIDAMMAHMTEAPGTGFGTIGVEDDFIHEYTQNKDPAVTETYWFSFSVPEEPLHGQIYVVMHPNLQVVSSGCWIWSGPTRHYLEADHFNYRHYLPYPTVDGSRVTVPAAGVKLDIVEPLRVIDVEYVDAASDTSVRFRAEGLIPPVVRASNKHFDQPMHLVGELTLNGRHYPLDCMSMRDRSWGEARPEIPNVAHPPVCWAVGVAADGTSAFVFSGVDDPAKEGGDWTEVFDLSAENQFKEGWIYTDGELRKLVSMSKSTERDLANLNRIVSTAAEVVDHAGMRHTIKGTMLGVVQWSAWSNIMVHWNQMRWEIDGTIGYGDALEMSWAQYAKHIRSLQRHS